MARPQKNTVDYFPHLIGSGKKITYIEHKYGNDGYATWFKILEVLATTDYHFLNLNDDAEIMFLSAKCRVSDDILIAIIDDLVKLKVFNNKLWENRILWSETFIETIQDVYIRRENKCMQYLDLCKHLSSLGIHIDDNNYLKSNSNTQTKLNKTKLNKTKLKTPISPEGSECDEGLKIDKIDFDVFWGYYEKKVGEKTKLKKKWDSLSMDDQKLILEHIPKYKAAQPDKRYRKNPETYLNNKSWLDEIIETNKNSYNGTTNRKTLSTANASNGRADFGEL